jgi:hypothetical protein
MISEVNFSFSIAVETSKYRLFLYSSVPATSADRSNPSIEIPSKLILSSTTYDQIVFKSSRYISSFPTAINCDQNLYGAKKYL